ncbi:MAG TPA: hypothetical protein VK828_21435 [Terriglobales bacterium]|nr:hypothetical protein [Terriglobales bacterium]
MANLFFTRALALEEFDVRAFLFDAFLISVLFVSRTVPAAAQRVAFVSQTEQNTDQTEQQKMDMPGMKMPPADQSHSEPEWKPSPENGSGTEWQPASTVTPMWMKSIETWEVMAHGVVFVDYNQQGGPRGEGKAESVNWLMLMEEPRLGSGDLLFREMFSAESLTSPHPGFPELFQTGETYHGQPLVDHQHPHNVFAELSFDYTHPIASLLKEKVSWEFYGAAAGEPALGPVAFMHRASASELPMAPLSHHLQDSTHTSFGVITTGVIVSRFKIEGSIFNGREPDEKRYTIQFAPLDSWSGRLSVAASKNWTAEYSYGRLEHPEAFEPGSQRRQTAAVEYVKPFANGSWATSVVWGRVHHQFDNHNLNGYLLETTANFKQRNYAFSRMELVDKDELFPDNPALPAFRIGAYTFGGAHDLIQSHLWRLALGADFTFYSKPSVLNAAYGQSPVSFQIFLRVRPAFRKGGS